MTESKSQNHLLNDYLRGTGRTINADQALTLFGVRNLRARVNDLRKLGLRVKLVSPGTYSIAGRDIKGSRKSVFN